MEAITENQLKMFSGNYKIVLKIVFVIMLGL